MTDASGNRTVGAGIVQSRKTGARARVGAMYAAKFQAYIDDLEAHGATIKFLGGLRRGHCSSGSQHPCGMALDVCQLSRDVVDRKCNLPSRSAMIHIASAHGLFEGGAWCNGDRGHAQVGSSSPCGMTQYASAKSHRRYARHRYRTQYAEASPYYASGEIIH